MVVMEPPVRSVFLNKNAPAALEVRIHGEPLLHRDVFAVQLALWNTGNQSVRPENVLEPLTFIPEGGTEIIETKVLRRTREVCGLRANVEDGGKRARVDWAILEHNDGAVVQLVLVGDQQCRIGLKGTVEGGGRPRFIRKLSTSENDSQTAWGSSRSVSDVLFPGVVVCLCVWGLLYNSLRLPRLWRLGRRSRKKFGETVFFAAFCVFFGCLGGYALYTEIFHSDRVPASLLSDVPTAGSEAPIPAEHKESVPFPAELPK